MVTRATGLFLLLATLVFAPLTRAQWATPDNSAIATNCTTPPCKVQINPGNTTNGGIALEAAGDIFATGTSINLSAESTAGPAALIANATSSNFTAVLLRSGGVESVSLRREATTNDFTIWSGNVERMRIAGTGGNVGIGGAPSANHKLQVYGNVNFTGTVTGGNIAAKFQDVAEWVPARNDLAPGTVVVLDPHSDNTVMASSRPYDTTVAGVVSAQPGLVLGEAAETKEQVATTGRVRVRVDASVAPIAIGDLLVTGTLPGTAMKSVAIDLGGTAIHRPGTIIGKALEARQSGVGEILVLLSMQ